jgi:hypothetical protein
MAVEILGREFSPRTPLEHLCVFVVLGFVLATSAYGTWSLGRRALQFRRVQARA